MTYGKAVWRAFVMVLVLGLVHCASPEKMQLSGIKGGRLPPLIDRKLFTTNLPAVGQSSYEDRKVSPDGSRLLVNRLGSVEVRPIDWENNIVMPKLGNPRLSPDGHTVKRFQWARDDNRVVLETKPEDSNQGEVWVVEVPKSDENVQVDGVERFNITKEVTGRAAFVKIPRTNSNHLYFAASSESTPSKFHLFRKNFKSGKKQRVAKSNGKINLWGVGAGKQSIVALEQKRGGGKDLVEFDRKGKNKKVLSCDKGDICEPLSFGDNGQYLYIKRNLEGQESGIAGLFKVSLKSGEIDLVHRHPKGKVSLADAVISEKSGKLLATAYESERRQWYAHTERMEKVLAFLRKRFPKARFQINSQSRQESLFWVAVERDTDVPGTYILNGENLEMVKIKTLGGTFPTGALAEMKAIQYKSRDGLKIQAFLTLPQGMRNSNLPLVVKPHGGPWTRDVWGFDAEVQFLANRGYAVLQPNFRGSTGYGQAFREAGNREWGRAMLDDINDGVQYLVDQGTVDAERVCIMGSSYGGYAALAALAFSPERYACGISLSGASDLVPLLSNPHYSMPLLRGNRKRIGDLTTREGRAELRSVSPYHHVDKIQSPVLMAHGTEDSRVPYSQSHKMAKALSDQGNDVTLLRAEGDGHGFLNGANRTAIYAYMERFLARHIGGRFQEKIPASAEKRLREMEVGFYGCQALDGC